MKRTGRNDLCPCGSGRKHKNCHGARAAAPWRRVGLLVAVVLLGIAALAWRATSDRDTAGRGEAPPGKVWSEEHGHYH